MSYTSSYGTAFGRVRHWGNGDGRFIYPPNRDVVNDKTKYLCGPVNSVRWEILREGVEDYEYFVLLEKLVKNAAPGQRALAEQGEILLKFPEMLFKDGQNYNKDPKALLEYRAKVAQVLNGLAAE